MTDIQDRREIIINPTKRHIADRNLPGHWENIRVGQTAEERSAAILLNIRMDESSAARGIDRGTGEKLSNTRTALARIRKLVTTGKPPETRTETRILDHWTDIHPGQTPAERQTAIDTNIRVDKLYKLRGIDRATGNPIAPR